MSHDTDRIEADINQSRNRLNDTIEALGSRLSPGQMLDEALGLAQGQAGQFAAKLGRQVRDNPLPTVLVAAGVAMLMMKQREGDHQTSYSAEDWHNERHFRSIEEARWRTARLPNESDSDYQERVHQAYAGALDLKQSADEAIDAFKERVAKTVHGIERRAASARDRLTQTFSGAAHYAHDQARHLGEKAGEMKHSAEDLYADNPLAAGAIALAVGALLGGATPLTQTERETLRGVAGSAARAGADLAERGARAVEERADALH